MGDLPVEPKSLNEDDAGDATLPPFGKMLCCPLYIGGGDGELVLLGILANELLLLRFMVIGVALLLLVVLDSPNASS